MSAREESASEQTAARQESRAARVESRMEAAGELGYYQADPWVKLLGQTVEVAAPLVGAALGVPPIPPVSSPTDLLDGSVGGPPPSPPGSVAGAEPWRLSTPAMIAVGAAVVGGAVYLARR